MFGQMVKRSPVTRELVYLIENNMVGNLDPPEHTRLRRILTTGIFNPAHLASLRARVAELVDEVLGRAETARRWDVLADLNLPVAFGFLTPFLGVAATDAKRLFSWSVYVRPFMFERPAPDGSVRRG